ncbi:MAG: hypothetical protein IT337_00035 [Thermomicrobiales bacterium]|nr:hypothetical protein [Thermomicrobiales bacterium]
MIRRLTRRDVLRASSAAVLAAAAPLSRRSAQATSDLPADRVRALYFNPLLTTQNDAISLADLIDRSELNGFVVDVKEQGVYVPTAVELLTESARVDPSVLDIDGLMALCAERDIYSIARIVCFRDNELAANRPDLAVLDARTSEPWQDDGGQLWLNPFRHETWDALAAFAVEQVARGFDEIQFDYVRFPSDGDLSALDFGITVDDDLRTDTIAAFLGYCRRQLAPLGAVTAVDVFGYTLLLDDIGIGQNIAKLARAVDVLCPMIYPSHFPDGSIAVPGHPNDFPAETIAISMADGAERIDPRRLRPWLQDFSLRGMAPYGPEQVRAQIDAVEAAGAGGWMIWDPASEFSLDAFLPDSELVSP